MLKNLKYHKEYSLHAFKSDKYRIKITMDIVSVFPLSYISSGLLA